MFYDWHLFVVLRSKLSRLPLSHIVKTTAKLAKLFYLHVNDLLQERKQNYADHLGKVPVWQGNALHHYEEMGVGRRIHTTFNHSHPLLLPTCSWSS